MMNNLLRCLMQRSTSTTLLNANHSGMSSPARRRRLNSVPESFITLIPLSLGLGSNIFATLCAHKVERLDSLDSELFTVLVSKLLGVVSPIKVFTVDGGLGASHVASNDPC